jgi:hypothetical protein
MNIAMIKVVACLAWAGAAISSANTANALVESDMTGPYAACAQSSDYLLYESCNGGFYLEQLLRFTGTGCSSGGGCWNGLALHQHTDFGYSSGRKPVTEYASCNEYYLLGLDSCAC